MILSMKKAGLEIQLGCCFFIEIHSLNKADISQYFFTHKYSQIEIACH